MNTMNLDSLLTQLADIIESRKNASADSSYVAQLFSAGEDKILKKVIEESGEVLMASKDIAHNNDRLHLVREVADVWFHLMVLLSYHGLRPEDVLMELKRRLNISGITEKAARKTH